jgi:hypothetical protein
VAREIEPLSKRARAEVLRIARTHPKLAPLLEDERAQLVIEPNFTDRRAPKDGDQVVVALYDYRRGESVVAVIDRGQERVLSVEKTPVQFQLSHAEQREAEELAGADPRVQRFLGGRTANPLTRLYFPPSATAAVAGHRHAIVFLRPSTSERRYAVVDLTEDRVVDVLHPRALTER